MSVATPRILIVAGSDSGGGAGLQADIKTVTMLGGHAMTAVTAITAQNTTGVQRVLPVPADMVIAQIESVVGDIGVDAVKIGMLGSAETAQAVADYFAGRSFTPGDQGHVPIVFDPVMVATSGAVLADDATVSAFGRLMRLATLTTPNLPELAALGGEAVVRTTATTLLVKGGHGAGDDLIDELITPGGDRRVWHGKRIETTHTHGTGCTLASAIATGLGAGLALDAAIARAIRFVRCALIAAPRLGKGNGPIGHSLGVIPFDQLEGSICPD